MSKELIERLRNDYDLDSDAWQAADRIEELEKLDSVSLVVRQMRRIEELEQERDQLREQVKLAHIALVETGQRTSCYKKHECIDGETRYGKGSYEDDLNNAMGGTPWQTCHCFPESYFKALAATEPKE